MTTIALTYCVVCEKMSQFANRFSDACVRLGYARAAADLARHGLHEEAKMLLLEKNKI
jgi:hypothetical protein|tara:strand:- start:393 stop:566 length:174 start_codon:yes stop_codon:yes gene_type:complete